MTEKFGDRDVTGVFMSREQDGPFRYRDAGELDQGGTKITYLGDVPRAPANDGGKQRQREPQRE